MMFWMAAAAGVTVAYLLGSLPAGYLAGRVLRGIDIRSHGSGSIGATNVLRTLGAWPAVAVLLIDVFKGMAAVWVARLICELLFSRSFAAGPEGLDLESVQPWLVCLAGLAVLLGHGRSIWLGFSGGKSAATGLGVLLAMSNPVGLGAAVVFLMVLAAFRIVSLSSMLAAVAAMALVIGIAHPLPYQLLVIAGGLYVVVRHRGNIGRLLAGTEPRLGQG